LKVAFSIFQRARPQAASSATVFRIREAGLAIGTEMMPEEAIERPIEQTCRASGNAGYRGKARNLAADF
jgi:hypothetical protein